MKIAVGAFPDSFQPSNGPINSAGSSGFAPGVSQLSRIEAAVLDALTMAISQSIASAIQEAPVSAVQPAAPVSSLTVMADTALPPVTQVIETASPSLIVSSINAAAQTSAVLLEIQGRSELSYVGATTITIPQQTPTTQPIREAIARTGDIDLPRVTGIGAASVANVMQVQQTVAYSTDFLAPLVVRTVNPASEQGKTFVPPPASITTTIRKPEKELASTIRIISGVPDTTELGIASIASGANNTAPRRFLSQPRIIIRVPISTPHDSLHSAGEPLDIELIEREELLHSAPVSTIRIDQQKIAEKRISNRQGSDNQSSQQDASQNQTAAKPVEVNKDDPLASKKVTAKFDKDTRTDISDFLKLSGTALPVVSALYLQYPAFNRRLETNGVDETLLWVNAFIKDGHSYAGHLGVTKPKTADTSDISTDLGDAENSTSFGFFTPDDNSERPSTQIWLIPLSAEAATKRKRKTTIVVERRSRNVAEDHIINFFQPQMSDTRGFSVVECAAFRDRRIWRGSAPASARSGATSYPFTFTANAAFPRDAAFFLTKANAAVQRLSRNGIGSLIP